METQTNSISITKIVSNLKSDKELRDVVYRSNIAMAYMDNYRWYAEETGKQYINSEDRELIAKKAADYFLKQLCDGNVGKEFIHWKKYIALVYLEKYAEYAEKTGKKTMSYQDRYIISNNAALKFLKLVCKDKLTVKP